MRKRASLFTLLALTAASPVAADDKMCDDHIDLSETKSGITDLTLLGGRNTRIYPKEITDTEYLKRLLSGNVPEDKGKFRADILSILGRAGFNEAESQEVIDTAIKTASQCQWPRGGILEWMSYREKPGRAEVQKHVRWSGSEPFRAFAFEVRLREQIYKFLIPAKCGNLALVRHVPPPPATCIDLAVRWSCDEHRRPMVTIEVAGAWANATTTTVTSRSGPNWKLSRDTGWRDTQEVVNGVPLELSAIEEGGRALPLCSVTLSPTCNDKSTCKKTPPPASCSVSVGAFPVAGGWDVSVHTSHPGKLLVRQDGQFHAQVPMDVSAGETRVTVKEPGRYSFELQTSDGGSKEPQASCRAEVTLEREPLPRSGWSFAAFFGKERRSRPEPNKSEKATCAPLTSTAVGLPPIRLGDTWELAPAIGVAYNAQNSANSTIFTDVRLDKRLPRGRVGFGMGLWDLNHSSTLAPTLAATGGWLVSRGQRRRPAVYVSAEARAFLDKLCNISNNYQFWFGLRLEGN